MDEREEEVNEALRKAQLAMDVVDLAHPELGFDTHERAFMEADLEKFFGEDASGDPAFGGWLIEKATEIVEAELETRGGSESEWVLYQRRLEIEAPRVVKALEILWSAGLIDDPAVLAEEDAELAVEEEEDGEDDDD